MPASLWDKNVRKAFDQITEALDGYLIRHPGAAYCITAPEAHGIRLRVVDPAFAGLDIRQRERAVMAHLDGLSDDVHPFIASLHVLAPGESPLPSLAVEPVCPELYAEQRIWGYEEYAHGPKDWRGQAEHALRRNFQVQALRERASLIGMHLALLFRGFYRLIKLQFAVWFGS